MKSVKIGGSSPLRSCYPAQADKGVFGGEYAVSGSAPTSAEAQKLERLIDKREVMRRVALGYTSIWKLMCEDKFPRSRELGRNKVAWVEREIDEFIRTRPVRRLKGDSAHSSIDNPVRGPDSGRSNR